MALVELASDAHGVHTIALNDPDRRNAMGLEMADAFRSTIDQLRLDTSVRVVVITGSGSAFSAGGDLEMLKKKASKSVQQNQEEMLAFYESFLGVLSLQVPLIAAVNGHAIGAGACVATACDYRVASSDAKIGFTFTRLGLHPGMGITYTLPRIVGTAIATDLLVTGRVVQSDEAAQLGLVNDVTTTEKVVAHAYAYARQLLATGPAAVSGLLASLRPPHDALQVALRREASQQAENYASSDFLEGINAALEKRAPNFRHLA